MEIMQEVVINSDGVISNVRAKLLSRKLYVSLRSYGALKHPITTTTLHSLHFISLSCSLLLQVKCGDD